MKREGRPLIFVDTNIYLDFYRMADVGMKLLKRLASARQDVIATCQVEMEFKKNRQAAIGEALKQMKALEKVKVPGFLRETRVHKRVERVADDLEEAFGLLRGRVRELLCTWEGDWVRAYADELFRTVSPHVLLRDSSLYAPIESAAVRRFQLGYPPRKGSDATIGDALNWEWIIRCASREDRDVIVVSADSDYGTKFENQYVLNDWLAQEFRDRTKRRAQLTGRLSHALEQLEIKVTPAEKEQELQAATPLPDDNDVLSLLSLGRKVMEMVPPETLKELWKDIKRDAATRPSKPLPLP